MKNNCQQYKQEIEKAKETIGLLESELHEIRLKLKNSPNNAIFMQEMKRVTLDMTITLNELEHSQNSLDRCMMMEHNRIDESKYND